jgi:hypothetical protein
MLFARVAGKCLLFRPLTGATGRNIGPSAALKKLTSCSIYLDLVFALTMIGP